MDEPLEALLYRAMTSPLGIVVESSDPDRLRQKLYPLRKAQPEFECLAFVLSPMNPTQLWILRKPDAPTGD
jgi:hypothetical protein